MGLCRQGGDVRETSRCDVHRLGLAIRLPGGFHTLQEVYRPLRYVPRDREMHEQEGHTSGEMLVSVLFSVWSMLTNLLIVTAAVIHDCFYYD